MNTTKLDPAGRALDNRDVQYLFNWAAVGIPPAGQLCASDQ